jgi:hypothetical protein
MLAETKYSLWLLLASVSILIIAQFLLSESISLQKWVTSDKENAPNPEAGYFTSLFSTLLILMLWVFYWGTTLHGEFVPKERLFEELLRDIFDNPNRFVPAFLVASIVPATMAAFKFFVTTSLIQTISQESSSYKYSPIMAIFGAIFSLLQLFASIVTLIMYFGSF